MTCYHRHVMRKAFINGDYKVVSIDLRVVQIYSLETSPGGIAQVAARIPRKLSMKTKSADIFPHIVHVLYSCAYRA